MDFRKTNWSNMKDKRDILSFILALIITQIIWKILFYDDFNDCRWDSEHISITRCLNNYCIIIARVTENFLKSFNIDYTLVGNVFYFPANTSLGIIWGCSGIKQMIALVIALLMAKGNFIYKIAYTILSLTIVFCINIGRILILAHVTAYHTDFFDVMHEVLKYFFYAVIFFLWAFWTEYILPKYLRNKKMQQEKAQKNS